MTPRPQPPRIDLGEGWALRPNMQVWRTSRGTKTVWKLTLNGDVKPFTSRGPRGGIRTVWNIDDPLRAIQAAGVTRVIYSENKSRVDNLTGGHPK